MFKLTLFLDKKLNLAEMMATVRENVNKLARKGENTDYQHFLLFLQGFHKAIRVYQIQNCEVTSKLDVQEI